MRVTQQDLTEVVQKYQGNVVSENELGQVSRQYLRQYSINSSGEPAEILAALEGTASSEKIEKYFTLAEVALLQAMALEKRGKQEALVWYLRAAESCFEGLFRTGEPLEKEAFNFRRNQLLLFYARAVAGAVQGLNKEGADAFNTKWPTPFGRTYDLSLARGKHTYAPEEFEELLLSPELDFSGITNRHRRDGLGVSFVGYRKKRIDERSDTYFPDEGIARPLSAVMKFEDLKGGGVRSVEMAFYDSRDVESVLIENLKVPLAADFSAPFAYLLRKTQLKTINVADTIGSDAALDTVGIYMVDPFDANRIPLLTVHGLLSSPATWIDVHNDLMGDRAIRENYQIWHFMYPPGLPVLTSAKLFRDKLDELVEFVNPERNIQALNRILVLSHSMGGLITRTVVANSGDKLWSSVFKAPPTAISQNLDPEEFEELRDTLHFQRHPSVERVIFVSVPHRGSPMADGLIARIGNSVIELPLTTLKLISDVKERVGDLIKSEVIEEIDKPMTSVSGLSSHSFAIRSLADIALERDIPFHSIIGDQGEGIGEDGSDGVVPYKSSHFEGAQSELIVPAGHSAHQHPLALLEIKRIAKLHLGELNR